MPVKTKTVESDIEIAQRAEMKLITEIGRSINIEEDDLELYGRYKAKISLDLWQRIKDRPNGKLILVSAINPTPAGEGKSTLTVGLGQAFQKLGKKTMIALREPSLGPSMGVKGGAAGGGYSQVVPMADINLHFTGDLHAITSAHNLLAALIDNHIHQGNELQLDPRRVVWKRVMDINDRALRQIVVGLGGPARGVPREDGFDITVASEVMAILCLTTGMEDLKERLGRMLIGYTYEQRPVTVSDLGAQGAMALLLKDAIKPNLVQTLENTPALIHGGPFANIAHGCNSIIATRMALKLADYTITEAGFGVDLGAEKFFHIKSRYGGLRPDAVVVVATIRALKMHGGVSKENLNEENTAALREGFVNLLKHIETIQHFGLPFVVALNHFAADTQAEIETISRLCYEHDISMAISKVWEEGGDGGTQVVKQLLEVMEEKESQFRYLYETEQSIPEKINIIATKVYGAAGVEFTSNARKQIDLMEKWGWDKLPICMAKTQYSLSDDPKWLGRPANFTITVRELKPSLGAGFIVALTGDVMTMPGLPKNPAALNMNIDQEGRIEGLF